MGHRDELRALVELGRAGNMRDAADAVGIRQSTLCDIINRLEHSYGALLFERDRRGSRPTAYGAIVVTAAEEALRVLTLAQREVALVRGSAAGRIAIGVEASLLEPYLDTRHRAYSCVSSPAFSHSHDGVDCART